MIPSPLPSRQKDALPEQRKYLVVRFHQGSLDDHARRIWHMAQTQVNITRLREQGQLAEATALEKLRLKRIRVHQQQKFEAEPLARQKAMQEQLAALRQEVEYLQILAQQAANAANAARAEAQSHH